MEITKIYTSREQAGAPSPKHLKIGQRALKTNLGLKQTDSLLIVTVPEVEKNEGALWFEAGKTITPTTQMVVFDGMTENGQEPPGLVALMMAKSDVVILQTKFSLSHTKARKNACRQGARIASLPDVPMEIVLRTLPIDYQPIANMSQQLASVLSRANTVHISTQVGTDLRLNITHRTAHADTGLFVKPGDMGNLPAGEAYLAPVEGTANGVFVVDGSFADIDLDKPMTITVKNGHATTITGGTAAHQLRKKIQTVGPKATNIGELGIGTNPTANPKGSIIEAEKALGTAHIALGNNFSFGGTVEVPFHSDGVILKPTLTVDKKTIIKRGTYLL